MEKCAVILIEV